MVGVMVVVLVMVVVWVGRWLLLCASQAIIIHSLLLGRKRERESLKLSNHYYSSLPNFTLLYVIHDNIRVYHT